MEDTRTIMLITVSDDVNEHLNRHNKTIDRSGNITVWDSWSYYRHESWPENQWQINFEPYYQGLKVAEDRIKELEEKLKKYKDGR